MKRHWAIGNPGLADHYRALARAACEAVGLNADADDVAPSDLTERLQTMENRAVTRGVCIAATTVNTFALNHGRTVLHAAGVTRQEAIDAEVMQFDLEALEGAFVGDESEDR